MRPWLRHELEALRLALATGRHARRGPGRAGADEASLIFPLSAALGRSPAAIRVRMHRLRQESDRDQLTLELG